MSGWENVPPDAPKQPGAPRKRGAAAATSVAAATTTAATTATESDDALVDDGRLAQLVDLYWPHAWIMMLITVCLIGIWAAIGKLPNHPSWWP